MVRCCGGRELGAETIMCGAFNIHQTQAVGGTCPKVLLKEESKRISTKNMAGTKGELCMEDGPFWGKLL